MKCLPIFVDTWEENKTEITSDVWKGEEEMELKAEEKYLGDIISSDGNNFKNIQERVNKGKGIIRNILSMLEGIPFGKYFFEVAIILRNSLLVGSVLFNCEAWYNLPKNRTKFTRICGFKFFKSNT